MTSSALETDLSHFLDFDPTISCEAPECSCEAEWRALCPNDGCIASALICSTHALQFVQWACDGSGGECTLCGVVFPNGITPKWFMRRWSRL
jgi:hypothetical protein